MQKRCVEIRTLKGTIYVETNHITLKNGLQMAVSSSIPTLRLCVGIYVGIYVGMYVGTYVGIYVGIDVEFYSCAYVGFCCWLYIVF